MKMAMRSIFIFTFTFLVISCGGGGGGGGGANAPSISNLQVSPNGAYVNSGGGTDTISLTLDVSDPDGNIATMTISVFDSNGSLVDTETGPIEGSAGVTSGTIFVSGTVDTTVLGSYTFKIYVSDSSGLKSNMLEATFKITEFPWQSKTVEPTPGTGRATSLNGIIYFISGSNGPVDPFTIFETYDPTTDTWSSKSSLPNTMGGFVVLAAVNGKVYGIGGGGDIEPGAAVEEYNPITDKWTLKSPMPTPRFGCGASVVNGKIYVIGGYAPESLTEYNTVEVYDPVADQWATAAPMPTPRKNLTTSVANGKIYAIGGYQLQSVSGYLSTVEEYNPLTNTWSVKTQMPYPPYENQSSGTVNEKIYVTGGNNWFPTNTTVFEYDPITDVWKAKTPIPNAVIYTTTTVINDKLYIISDTATYEYTPSNDIL